jgi:CRISPR-associated protein Cst1
MSSDISPVETCHEAVQKESKINSRLTGDPFVDAGIIAIELITGKSWDDIRAEEFRKAVDNLISIYLTPAWSKDLQSIFPNSKFINASIKDRVKESKDFLYDLVSGLNTYDEREEYCAFCGNPAHKRNDNKPFTKSQIPLVGSSDFTNYFPSFQNGISICARCALAFQFAPIVSYKAGGKPCIISSNNPAVIRELGREAIIYITEQKVLGAYQTKETSGIFDERFRSAQNALFHLAYKITTSYKNTGISSENEEITIYHIDNYNQTKKGVTIYSLPNNVFCFVGIVMSSPQYRASWFSLLTRHYSKPKKESDDLPVWKVSYNSIHDQLLKNQSILWAFKDEKTRTLTIPFIIVERYAKLVRGMSKQRIETIKKMADRIAECIEETGNKKRVNDILSARDLISFRNQLRLVCRDWQKKSHEEPLISFDEYIEVIIPGDYYGWTEVRDLIVIRLYEKLHPILIKDNECMNIDENITGEQE